MAKRALTTKNMLTKKFTDMHFEGEWEASFGHPETNGVWLIWGGSGNGKTSFALKLAAYLTKFARVAYDSLEEGHSKSLKLGIIRAGISSTTGLIFISEDITELRARLDMHRSPQIIIIDSFQYTGLTKSEYKALKRDYPTKLFIFISHAEGNQPEGRAAKFVKYDADCKIQIEGYKAFVVSRYGGGDPYTIWKEGAEQYWNALKE